MKDDKALIARRNNSSLYFAFDEGLLVLWQIIAFYSHMDLLEILAGISKPKVVGLTSRRTSKYKQLPFRSLFDKFFKFFLVLHITWKFSIFF